MLRNKAGHHRKVPGTGAEIQRSGNFKLSGGTDLVGSGYRRLLIVLERQAQLLHKPFHRNSSSRQMFAGSSTSASSTRSVA